MTLASSSSLSKIELLHKRAEMLNMVRNFFSARNIIEVDTPMLSSYASIDTHIDLFEVKLNEHRVGYLQSSPEYAMKRLLAMGMKDIYQLSHVYRKEELGRLHHPIFTLIEWYRSDVSYSTFIEEALELLALFLGKLSYETLTYREVFQKILHIDPFLASEEDLLALALERNLSLKMDKRDILLPILWGSFIEKHLGLDGLTIITEYPATQAALAQTKYKEEAEVAERFEIYAQGIEIANGYHELKDPHEQQRRLEKANRERKEEGKKALPLDLHFLNALKKGLPDCYGIAVGFDRLLMLQYALSSIHKALPFSWYEEDG